MAAPQGNRPLHPPINAEHEAGQAASTVFQVFGATPPGIEPATSFSSAHSIPQGHLAGKNELNLNENKNYRIIMSSTAPPEKFPVSLIRCSGLKLILFFKHHHLLHKNDPCTVASFCQLNPVSKPSDVCVARELTSI